jgi:hypothetical protein
MGSMPGLPQLRAAIGLCHSQRQRGDAQNGSERLSAIYASFTEGFATRDLIEAGTFWKASRTRAPVHALGADYESRGTA